MACKHGDRRFLKVLSLRLLAPPSKLFLSIGTWLKVMELLKNSEFAGVGCTVEDGFDYRGLARSNEVPKSIEFAGVGSTVEVAFVHRGPARIRGHFKKFSTCECWLYRGSWL